MGYTEDEAKEILEMMKKHMKPTLFGKDSSQVYKTQKSVTLSKKVFEQLPLMVESPNKFIDFLLAQLFGFTYEECYGRKAVKHKGKNILWDYQEMYKLLSECKIEIKEVKE